ncbi:MAG: hypothetical protein ACRD5L_06435, partial [Bryobacteraceae bacterium]
MARQGKFAARAPWVAAAAALLFAMPAMAQVSSGVGQGAGSGAAAGNHGGVASGQSSGTGRSASGGTSAGIGSGVAAGVGFSDLAGVASGVADFAPAASFSRDDQDKTDREEELYSDGTDAIDDGKWDKAIAKFAAVAEMKGKKADAALYFKAYAENKDGKREQALLTIKSLTTTYPSSRWVNDAKALDIEIRQRVGQPVSPESQSDCDLKLMALNGLQQADPEKAVPLLEKMLHGGDCPKLASQSLFVLAQSNSQQARDLMAKIARGDANPDLQIRAIRNLGLFSGTWGREILGQIYASTNDLEIKKRILNSFMLSGDRDRIVNAAKNEKVPALRSEAIRQLGLMGAKAEIWQLYQNETSVDVKKTVLQSMFLAGDVDHVGELARNEKDHSLRLAAIRVLGLMGKQSEDVLLGIYNSDSDMEVRKEVIRALFL